MNKILIREITYLNGIYSLDLAEKLKILILDNVGILSLNAFFNPVLTGLNYIEV